MTELLDVNERLLVQVLEDIQSGRISAEQALEQHAGLRDSLEALLLAAGALKSLPRMKPSQAFRQNARIRILNRARANGQKIQATPPKIQKEGLAQKLTSVFSTMTVVIAVLFLGIWLTLSANTALPGDFLYPFKLATEKMQLVGADPAEQAILQTRIAGSRLSEIQLLTVQERYEDIPIAVEEFEQTINASIESLASVARSESVIATQVYKQMQAQLDTKAEVLTQLLAVVPVDTRPVIQSAIMATSIYGPPPSGSG